MTPFDHTSLSRVQGDREPRSWSSAWEGRAPCYRECPCGYTALPNNAQHGRTPQHDTARHICASPPREESDDGHIDARVVIRCQAPIALVALRLASKR